MKELTNAQTATVIGLASSGITAVFEYRGEKIESIKWIDKQTGKAQEMPKHAIAAESVGTGEQVAVEVYIPRDGAPLATGLQKGDLFTGQIMSYFVEKGKASARMRSIVRLDGVAAGTEGTGKDYVLKPKAAPAVS